MNMKLTTQTPSCHRELGLLFEQRFIEELKKYYPKTNTTAGTAFKFISDVRIDYKPHEYDLIEIKSHKYFPNQTTLDVFETIMNSGIERTKQSGIKQGLFHQFNEAIKANDGGWTVVIVGCYLQDSRQVFDLWSSDPEEAWNRYSFYKMLLWNGREVRWCHIGAYRFWEEHRMVVQDWDCDYGIQQPLMMLSSSLIDDFSNFSNIDDEISLLEFYQYLELDLTEEELQASVEDVLSSIPTKPLVTENDDSKEELVQGEDMPELIDGISLTELDLQIIKASLESGNDLYETSLLINKSKSYLHVFYTGQSTYRDPKFNKIREWMKRLMKSKEDTNKDQADLISIRQNKIILELQEERKSLNDKVTSQRNQIQKLEAENLNFAFQLGSKVQNISSEGAKAVNLSKLEAAHSKQIAKLEEDLDDALKMVNRFERIIDNLLNQLEEKS